MTVGSSPDIEAAAAEGRVLELVIREGQPLVVVKSPPGAGKTRLVTGTVAVAREYELSVVVAAPRNEQVHEIVRRLLLMGVAPVQCLRSSEAPQPDDLTADPRVIWHTEPATVIPAAGPVITTVAKLEFSAAILSSRFSLLICDEAWQLPYGEFMPISLVASQVLLVGDPGQLPPLVRADPTRFEAADQKVHWPAAKELLRRFPDVPVVPLPATWRLPQDSVDFLQPSLYSDLPFKSAAAPDSRRLSFRVAGVADPLDPILDRLSAGQSIVVAALPAATFSRDEVDDELASTGARLARRLLERGATWEGVRELGPRDIGCGDPHVASGERMRRQLEAEGVGAEVMVTTPEIWQGQQRPIMLVKHPLSGARSLSEFDLDPGRLCVLLSRHQLGCVLLTRDGLLDALDRHEHDSTARPSGAENVTWKGWRGNLAIAAALEEAGRVVRL